LIIIDKEGTETMDTQKLLGEVAGQLLSGAIQVVDLSAPDAERLPPPEALRTEILGILIPRIPAGVDYAPAPLVIAALTMTAISSSPQPTANCPKGIGNHISPTLATE